jgi:RHS repeat-associated protein
VIIPEGQPGAGIELLAVVQEQHYSLSREVRFGNAWGLAFTSTSSVTADRFTYNSKELVTDLDLGWNDFGFRMYDASVGRWSAVDPLAELDGNYSPYTYVYNNPLGFVDHFGLHPDSAANYAAGAVVENNTGSWTYLGDGQWQTNWEASSSSSAYVGYYSFFGEGTNSSGSSIGPSNGFRGNTDSFSWSSYLDGVNQRSGLVAAGGSLLKNYPSLYRDAGKFTTQYWSKVRMLGKSFQVANQIDKIANLKVKGLPALGIVNAGVETFKIISKYNNGESIKASDVGGALFNSAIGFLAFTNPVTATAMAIYVIADYSGVLDPAKAYISQTVDNAFQK